MAFEEMEFLVVDTVVGNKSTASNGEVVANLTRRTFVSTGLYLLSSTLIIHPPLNSIDFNNTNIKCEGVGSTGLRSDVTPISIFDKNFVKKLVSLIGLEKYIFIYLIKICKKIG